MESTFLLRLQRKEKLMNVQAIRIQLIRRDLKLKDLAGLSGIDYDRLQKVLHGYRQPRLEEVRAIASVLSMRPEELQGEAPDPNE